MHSNEFVANLKYVNFKNVFNPYVDTCPEHDGENAPKHRFDLLHKILDEATNREIDSIWIGRDLGYRGGRRTGLALTDDIHINAHANRWGLSAPPITKGDMYSELTAKSIWDILENVDENIFLWNVFPFHPHEPGTPFSNRSHNAEEHHVGKEILDQLIGLLNPKRLITIGNDAHETSKKLAGKRQIYKVRHPSYGGKFEFITQMQSVYNLRNEERA